MAARYWVGGTAAWDGTAGTKWALTSGGAGGQAVPTSVDDVFFDASSGTGTVTISTGNTGAQSINCTGFTGTLTFNAGVTISVAGSVTYVAGMTLTINTGIHTLTATGTLTTGGKTLGTINITGSTTVSLGSALTCGQLSIVSSTSTLNTTASNYNITASSLSLPTVSGGTLTLNGSTVTLSGSFGGGGSPTINAGTSTINLTGAAPTFNGASRTYNNVTFSSTSGGRTNTRSVAGANTFSNLTFTAPASAGYSECVFSASQTVTTLVCAGASAIRRMLVRSNTAGTSRTLTVGTYTTKTDVDFLDITAAGASSPWSGTRLGNCKGNSNITFDVAKTVYWNLTGSQAWSATGWATSSGGVPAVNNFPLPQDSVVFDNAGAATTVDTSEWHVGSVNSSSRTSAMTLTGGGLTVLGDWTAGSGVTQSFTVTTSFNGRTTQTITSNGKTFDGVQSISPGTAISLADALTASTLVRLSSTSSFDASIYTVTTFQATFGTGSSVNLGTASWTISGDADTCWTAAANTVSGTAEIVLSNNTTSPREFIGGGNAYSKLTIGGATSTSTTTISGANTFGEIASTKTVAHTIVFPNATTTVGTFSVTGTVGNVVTISGTSTLLKSGGGVVSSNYLSISSSTATPAGTWYAGANSTDGGGNTGWIFTAAPLISRQNFMAFFM